MKILFMSHIKNHKYYNVNAIINKTLFIVIVFFFFNLTLQQLNFLFLYLVLFFNLFFQYTFNNILF
jgi:hypothetical protein